MKTPAVSLLLLIFQLAGCAGSRVQNRAVELYDAGNYAEARTLLEEIDAGGEASGSELYRLFYCQQAGGDRETSRQTLERATQKLEIEVDEATALEIPFYLVNAYQNAARNDDALRVAEETVARVESGEIEHGKSGVGAFRLGKLYADHGNVEQASTWYETALEELEKNPSRNAGYVRWASRYLASPAYGKGDFAAAEKYYTAALADGGGSARDYDDLASARARVGKYAGAAEAWKKTEEFSPAESNRPRYCGAVAKMAAHLGSLPDTDEKGRTWDKILKEELEAVMLDNSTFVKQTIQEALDNDELELQERRELQLLIDGAQSLFVAAAMEYGLRRYGIRETAFLGGYAPMIFHQKLWDLEVQLRRATKGT